MRKVTDMVSEGCIWGVGITRPRPGKERRAAIYITSILVLTIFFAVSMFLILKSYLA